MDLDDPKALLRNTYNYQLNQLQNFHQLLYYIVQISSFRQIQARSCVLAFSEDYQTIQHG